MVINFGKTDNLWTDKLWKTTVLTTENKSKSIPYQYQVAIRVDLEKQANLVQKRRAPSGTCVA